MRISRGDRDTTTLLDKDGDTKIQVEESADEDIIRIDAAGSEVITIHKTGDILRILSNAADQGFSLKQAGLGPADPYTATFRVNDDGNNAELDISLIGAGAGPSAIRLLLDGSKIFTFTGNSSLNIATRAFVGPNDGFTFRDDLSSPTARLFEIGVAGDVIMRQVNPITGDNFIESAAWRPFDDAVSDFGTSDKRWKDGYFSGTIRSASSPTSIQVGGSVNVGTDAAADTSSSIDLSATDRALLLNRLTTTQRDALTALNGMAVYNATTNKFQIYENGAWVDWAHSNADDHTKASSGHVIVFAFPDESLSAAVFLPRPSFRLLDKLPVTTAEANQRFTVTAGTVGSGTNTVVLESSTDRSAWTIQATAALDAVTEIVVDGVFTADWVWNPTTEYLRVRCSALGTAPKDIVALFDYD